MVDISPTEVAVQSKARPGTYRPSAPSGESIQFKRNIFLQTERTGARTNEKTSKREKGVESPFITLSGELRTQYTTFLEGYLRNLRDVNRDNPAVLRTANHRHDREILQRLTNAAGEPDEAKIQEFLKQPEGWMIATQVLEYQTALKIFSLGLVAAARKPNDPKELRDVTMIGNDVIRIGVEQGILNRFYQEKIVPHLRSIAKVAGTAGLSTGAYAYLGSAVAGIVNFFNPGAEMTPEQGALLAAAIPAAIMGGKRSLDSLIRDGITVDLRQSSRTLTYMRNNPTEATFVKAMTGIDVNDFQVVNPTRIIARNDRALESTHVAEMKTEIVQALYTRQEFYTSIGVPIERLDALPEQFLYRYDTGQMEQTGTRWQSRIQEAFRREGGILDAGGNRPSDPLFDANNLATEDNLRRFMRARRRVIVEMTQDLVRREVEQKELPEAKKAVDEKITQRGETGEVRRQRVDQLNTDQTALQTELTSLQTYETDLTKRGTRRDELDRQVNVARNELTAASQRISSATMPGGYANYLEAIAALQRVFQEGAGARRVTVDGRIISPTTNRRIRLEEERATLIQNVRTANPQRAGEPDNVYNARITPLLTPINLRIDRRLAVVDEDVTFINETIASLRSLQTTIQTRQTELANHEASSVPNAEQAVQNLDQMGRDFATVTALEAAAVAAGLAAPGLTEADLLAQPYGEIARRINALHAAGRARLAAAGGPITIGWPEQDNAQQDIRLRVHRTMAEARARRLPPASAVAAPSADFTAAINDWRLSEHQLRSHTVEELFRLINAENTRSGGARGWDAANNNAANQARVEQAIADARGRLDRRRQALDEHITSLRQTTQERGGQTQRELDNLNLAKALMDRQGEIFNAASEMSVLNINRFTSTEIVPNTDADFTPAEWNAGYEQGYFELINLLFDYRVQTDREARFRQIQAQLPPLRLAGLLNDSLGLRLIDPATAPPGTAATRILTLPNVLDTVRSQFNRGRLSSWEMRGAFSDIINTYRDQALAT